MTKRLERHVQFAEFFAKTLDSRFRLGGVRFGLGGIIDLIPGIGDMLDAILSGYLVWLARELGLPSAKIYEMMWNIILSFIIGLIPVVGDAVYIIYKPNMRNLRIITAYLRSPVVEGEIIPRTQLLKRP